MKKRTKKLFILSGITVVLGTVTFLAYGIYSFMTSPFFEEQDHQPDEVLITNFREHRVEFEQLKAMVIRDDLMTRVDDNWTNPTNLASDQVTEYRRLFKVVGTPRGISSPVGRERIQFIASSQGWVASGSSKGYLYLRNAPRSKDLLNNLDDYNAMRELDKPFLRHIEGNWYLFFQR